MRQDRLNSVCQICGSTDRLALHHRKRRRTFQEIVEDLLWEGIGRPPRTTEVLSWLHAEARHPYHARIEAHNIFEKEKKEYLSGEDTITLCASCHYKVENGALQDSTLQLKT